MRESARHRASIRRAADALLDRALSIAPGNLRARLLWCDIPRFGGDGPASAQRFEQLVADVPTCDVAHYNLGAIYLQSVPERALHHFERGEALAPRDADYPIGRARALIALGRLGEARAALASARTIAPAHPRIPELDKALAG